MTTTAMARLKARMARLAADAMTAVLEAESVLEEAPPSTARTADLLVPTGPPGSNTKENTMESWHTYPRILAIGHAGARDLLLDPVLVEEKVDGSQFSFGRFIVAGESVLKARSKGAVLNMDAPERMFQRAVDVVSALPLHEGWTYRAEYLQKPKHNALAYDRAPRNNLIVFDINDGHESYLSPEDKAAEAERLGLECVPVLFRGVVESALKFRELLDTVSVLGGQKVEGVVVKNYTRFGQDGKAMMGKFVSEAFQEVHGASWKESNPGQADILHRLVNAYKTPARWDKAVQHLREAGNLDQSPKDIGALIKEVQADVMKECREDIADMLLKWAMPHVNRGIIGGLPEWYKEKLLHMQFEE